MPGQEVQVTELIQEQIVPERSEEQIGAFLFVEESVILRDRLQQPQIQQQIIENVQEIPRELFPEHFEERERERDIGCGVALTRRCPCSACSLIFMQRQPAPAEPLSSSRTCANALRKGLRRLRCLPNVARKGRPRQVSPAQRTLNKFLRNAADRRDTPVCLGSWRMLFTWPQTCGHLRDAPDLEEVQHPHADVRRPYVYKVLLAGSRIRRPVHDRH